MEVQAIDLQPIADMINLIYSGEPRGLKDDLLLTIYLLHHVDQECVGKDEMDKAVFTLKSLVDSLQTVDHQENL